MHGTGFSEAAVQIGRVSVNLVAIPFLTPTDDYRARASHIAVGGRHLDQSSGADTYSHPVNAMQHDQSGVDGARFDAQSVVL
jgi:hypothetical protein